MINVKEDSPDQLRHTIQTKLGHASLKTTKIQGDEIPKTAFVHERHEKTRK
jgi:hypothetical protein